MKQNSILWAVVVLLGWGFTACNTYEPVPEGKNVLTSAEADTLSPMMSIADFKTTFDKKDTLFSLNTIDTESPLYIRGRVVTTDESGNIYKYLVMQDTETGDALKVSIDAGSLSGAIPMGQEIVINCKGLTLGRYAGQEQLGVEAFNDEKLRVEPGRIPYPYFNERLQFVGNPDVEKIYIEEMTISEMNDRKDDHSLYGRLIRIKDVHFTGLGDEGEKLSEADKIFAPSTFNGTYNVGYPQARQIADAAGNIAYVSTSEYARFAEQPIPSSDQWGDVVAIIGYYRDKADAEGELQLTIRTLADLEGFEVSDKPDVPQDGVLFSETFSSSLGEFTIEDKNLPAGLNFVWTYKSDYQCAVGSAYYKQNYVAESWLVSPSIALNGKPATLTFDHAVNYMKNSMQEDLRLMYSTDEGATWNEAVIPTYPSGNSFDFVSSGEIGLPAASTIKIAFAYQATSKGACTWEIKNVKVLDKESSVVNPENPDTPSHGEGDGSKENPYNVEAAKSVQDGSEAWVKAYIVGQVTNDWDVASDMQYDAPFTGGNNTDGSQRTYGTNLLIAADATAHTTAQVMPVQLPSGAVRMALNLVENPEMDGKEVLLYGALTKYFGVPGMKEITCAIVDGTVYGVDPTTVVTPEGGVIFEESFASSMGNFTADNKVMDDAMTYVWSYDERYKCAKASGYVSGTRYETESWLISPSIALNGKVATLSFEHAANYVGTATEEMRLFYTTDEGATWNELTIPTYATSWTFVPSGVIELPAAQSVKIAFVYNSTTSNACTWEVKNVKVYQ